MAMVSAGETNAVERFVKAIEVAASGSIICTPRNNALGILCIANTTGSEAEKIVLGIVHMANLYDVGLHGWKITMVTQEDYVITRSL